MDALFQAVTMIIPKAGVQLGGAPLTLNIILFIIVLLRNPNQTMLSIQENHNVAIGYAVLLFFGLFTFTLALTNGTAPFQLAQIVTVVASPLAGVIALRMKPEKSFRILCIALVLVNLYASAQFFLGITRTAIAGLTYTYGQDPTSKPIGYGMSANASASKMPSTFQNGNYLGIFDALGISLLLMWKPFSRLWIMLRYAGIVCGILGIVMCGSRSTIIPFALVAALLLVQRYRATQSRMKGTYLLGVAVAGLSGFAYLLVYQPGIINQFVTRNITQTLNDPTASGRTNQWSGMWQTITQLNNWQLLRLTFFGQGADYGLGGEGLPTFFATFGLFSTLAFYSMLVAAIVHLWRNERTRTVALGVFCTFFAFCIDSSFYYPPNVMMTFMVIGIALRAAKESSATPERDDAVIRQQARSHNQRRLA
ncbi:MAG: hypothetical protein SOI66_02535 [Bifidobacterium sp.]|jgi:hypothetical protein